MRERQEQPTIRIVPPSPNRSWDTTDELKDVQALLESGITPGEALYEVDDIIKEFADPELLHNPDALDDAVRMERAQLRSNGHAAGQDTAQEPQDTVPAGQQSPQSDPDQPAEETTDTALEQPPLSADAEETARFVQEQVSEAITEQEDKAFLQRLKERLPFHRKKQDAKDGDPLGDTIHVEDNVYELPPDPLQPLRDSIHDAVDRMNSFADGMFQAERLDEQTRLEQEHIPGTDKEEPSAAPPRPPKKPKGNRAKQPWNAAPDLSAASLARRFRSGLDTMKIRIAVVALLGFLMLILSLLWEMDWPLPQPLRDRTLQCGLLTWLLAVCTVLGLDIFWMGLSAPLRGKTGLHTMMSLAVIATLLDGGLATYPGREGPLPMSALAALVLCGAMWGAYDRKLALYTSCRAVSNVEHPYRVTLDNNLWKERPSFEKVRGRVKGFGSQIQSMDGAIGICHIVVPFLMILAVVLSVMAAYRAERTSMMMWCFSIILLAGSPVASLLIYGQPLLRVTKRLDRYGAVLAGWIGASRMSGKTNILIRDDDLFPKGCVKITHSRFIGGISQERVVACTASLLRAAGSGLAPVFDELLTISGGFYRQVEELECSEAGGFSGVIRGRRVLVGNYNYMAVNQIPIDAKIPLAVYCVIDRQVKGIFKMEYKLPHYVAPALRTLIRAGIVPVLATRDFNINPGNLSTMGIPSEELDFPEISRRRQLSQRHPDHGEVLNALLLLEGLGGFCDAIVGGRRLCAVTRINTVLTLFASLTGILLTFFLTSMMAFGSLTVGNMAMFLGLWLIPVLLVSGFANRF